MYTLRCCFGCMAENSDFSTHFLICCAASGFSCLYFFLLSRMIFSMSVWKIKMKRFSLHRIKDEEGSAQHVGLKLFNVVIFNFFFQFLTYYVKDMASSSAIVHRLYIYIFTFYAIACHTTNTCHYIMSHSTKLTIFLN